MTLTTDKGHSGQRGGAQFLNIVSESGLYALIFKSRKPQAKVFRKWVTSEVLPAIRKTGRYEMPQAPAGETVETVPLIRFIQDSCEGWSLDRQMDFGLKVRRMAKAMGIVFQVVTDAQFGRVFCFSRAFLQYLHEDQPRFVAQPQTDEEEFGRLLDCAAPSKECASTFYSPEMFREYAASMGFFPHMFRAGVSLPSKRSAFGKLCERFNGAVFPHGVHLTVRRRSGVARYEVAREAKAAMAVVS